MPAAPLAFLLLFATNFFSGITPQGSSANLLFCGQRLPVCHRRNCIASAISTAFNLLVFLLGSFWVAFVTG